MERQSKARFTPAWPSISLSMQKKCEDLCLFFLPFLTPRLMDGVSLFRALLILTNGFRFRRPFRSSVRPSANGYRFFSPRFVITLGRGRLKDIVRKEGDILGGRNELTRNTEEGRSWGNNSRMSAPRSMLSAQTSSESERLCEVAYPAKGSQVTGSLNQTTFAFSLAEVT